LTGSLQLEHGQIVSGVRAVRIISGPSAPSSSVGVGEERRDEIEETESENYHCLSHGGRKVNYRLNTLLTGVS
jgi:hypothetical protein